MPNEYVFEFSGTKDMFLSGLERFPHNDSLYYFDDYMVKLVGDEIHVGVERAGHSGGYWFVSKMVEGDGKMTFFGTIEYIGPSAEAEGEGSKGGKILKKIGIALVFLLILPPIALIFYLYSFVEWCIRKLRRAKKKPKTTEEKLCDVMQNYLGCIKL